MDNLRSPSRSAGFGLVEVLVAVGIMGIVAVVFAQLMKNQLAAQSHVNLRADLRQIATSLGQEVDCKKTLGPYSDAAGVVTCPSTSSGQVLIPLLDSSGNTLIAATAGGSLTGATVVGGWTLRATCYDASNPNPGLILQAAKPKATSSLYDDDKTHFYTDKLNGAALWWGTPATKNFAGSELFFYNARPCKGFIKNPVPKSTTCAAGAIYCDKNYGSVVQRTGDLNKFPTPATWTAYCNTPLATKPMNLYGAVTDLPTGWMGQAWCPAGYIVSGGGVNCQDAATDGGVCGAIMASSHPLTDASSDPVGWNGFCCRTQNCPTVSKGAVWVSCVPKNATAP